MTTYSTGQTPGKGDYYCTKCQLRIILANDTDKLPICPKCKNTTYVKR